MSATPDFLASSPTVVPPLAPRERAFASVYEGTDCLLPPRRSLLLSPSTTVAAAAAAAAAAHRHHPDVAFPLLDSRPLTQHCQHRQSSPSAKHRSSSSGVVDELPLRSRAPAALPLVSRLLSSSYRVCMCARVCRSTAAKRSLLLYSRDSSFTCGARLLSGSPHAFSLPYSTAEARHLTTSCAQCRCSSLAESGTRRHLTPAHVCPSCPPLHTHPYTSSQADSCLLCELFAPCDCVSVCESVTPLACAHQRVLEGNQM